MGWAAPAIVRLAYGDAFASAAPILQWLSGICILAAIHGHYRFGLIAVGQETRTAVPEGIGTFVALASIPFGYRSFGPSGAAVAVVVGELAVAISAWILSRGVYRRGPS